MILEALAIGFLSNLLYDTSKNVYRRLSDDRSDPFYKIYITAGKELLSKYPRLNSTILDSFLEDEIVKDAIINYFSFPDKDEIDNVLISRFCELFDESYFSKEDTKLILEDFVRILNCHIQNDPELKENLILFIVMEIKKEQDKSKVRLKIFTTASDFFAQYTDENKLFNHTYSLVGRGEVIEQLYKFVKSDKKIALLPGRGGIGKSKALLEFGTNFKSKCDDWELLFLNENISLSNDSLRELPNSKCVIVVDDAHRNENISILFEISKQSNNPVKIILSFRPHGLDYLKSRYTKSGFDTREIESISEMKELERKDLEELGKSILGNESARFLEPLIQVSKDSTLAFVIGARLIAEEKIDPLLLVNHQEFQDTVFQRFKDDLLAGVISHDLDKEFCQKLLSLISILSPIDESNENFKDKASKFLSKEPFELKRVIGIFERYGILLRRASKIRITPDVLSDHIVYNACITPSGDSIGYAEAIFDLFADVFLDNILYNLAELDWRVNNENKSANLLNDIWQEIDNRFKRSSNYQRLDILKSLRRIAYFQPKRVLELIEYTLRNPAGISQEDKTCFYQYSHQDILNEIPNILKNIAYNVDYLSRCCDLLWDLGKDDERQIHSNTNSAIRILVDFAKYDLYKPLKFNSTVVDFVERKLKSSYIHEHVHSLLDIIDPLMEKAGIHSRLTRFTLQDTPFFVPYHDTESIRSKAITILENTLKVESPKVKLRALGSLIKALSPPIGYYGVSVPDEVINQWLPEQIRIFDIIKSASEQTTDSILQIQIISLLLWHAEYSKQEKVAEKASSIINSIPNSFDVRVTRAIWYQYNWDYENYSQYQEDIDLEIRCIVKELLSTSTDSNTIYSFLNNKLLHFANSGIEANPRHFLELLTAENYELATDICTYIISDPSTYLSKYFSCLLSGIRDKNLNEAIEVTKVALESDNLTLQLSISEGYGNSYWLWTSEDVPIIEQLLALSNENTKAFAIKSLIYFHNGLETEAIRIALKVEVGENEKLADVYCGIFGYQGPKYGIQVDKIITDDVVKILLKLLKVRSLDDNLHNLTSFLEYCSNRIPEELVEFLLKRVDLVKEYHPISNEFRPLPFIIHREGFNGVQSSVNYGDLLRKVRNHALNKDVDMFWLSKLFSYISGNFCLISLGVLNEWINSNDENKIKVVGHFVKEAPSDFVFSNSDFVSNLLEKAEAINDDCYMKIRSDVSDSAIYGPKTGICGQPSIEDEQLRDTAIKFMGQHPRGSVMWRFYNYLFDQSNRSIKHSLERDQEILDE